MIFNLLSELKRTRLASAAMQLYWQNLCQSLAIIITAYLT